METTPRRIARLMAARLVLCLAVFGIALVFVGAGEEGREGVELGLYATIAFTFLATLVYAALFRFVRRPARFAAIQLTADVGIVTSLVFFSGVILIPSLHLLHLAEDCSDDHASDRPCVVCQMSTVSAASFHGGPALEQPGLLGQNPGLLQRGCRTLCVLAPHAARAPPVRPV